MYPCATCGREIDHRADACPGCGRPSAGLAAVDADRERRRREEERRETETREAEEARRRKENDFQVQFGIVMLLSALIFLALALGKCFGG